MGTTELFDFATFADGPGYSGFGHAHGPGIDLRPELPQTTQDLIGIDLTHRIDTSEIGGGVFSSARGGGGGGGGGSGGGTTFTNYTTAGAAGSVYNITIEFKGTWTTQAHDIFVQAADRLASLITGEIPDVNVIMRGGLRLVDDIFISAELKAIDGVGGILGQAGPTSMRTGSYFPATATMQFDSADTANYVTLGLFDEIVTHEMLHSVGFGSIWSYKGVVSGSDFVGTHAVTEFQALLAAAGRPADNGVPIETDGGSGTAGAHWDEAYFNNELMTGYINGSNNLLSKMTVASLWDLGYQVSMNSAGIDSGYVLT
jgi:leishmanolysin